MKKRISKTYNTEDISFDDFMAISSEVNSPGKSVGEMIEQHRIADSHARKKEQLLKKEQKRQKSRS